MSAITGLKPAQSVFTPAMRIAAGGLAVLLALIVGALAGLDLSLPLLLMAMVAPFALILVLARPQWAAIVYIVLVYADLLSILVKYHGIPPLARFAGVALLSAVLGYRTFVHRERLVGDRVTIWMLAYGAVVALGVVYARAPDLVVSNVIEFIRNFFTYLIIINIITTSTRLHTALYSLLGAGTALASLTLLQSFTGSFDSDYGGLAQYRVSDIAGSAEAARPGGTLGDANYYGQLLLILVPVALYLFFEGKTRRGRLIGLVCAATLTAAVIFTYSRGDAVALGVVAVAALIYKRPNPLLVAGGVLALLLALPLLPTNYLARLTTVLDVAQGNQQTIYGEDSIRGRAGATQAAIEMFANHPILGVGRENYPLYELEYISGTAFARAATGIPPHNLYLEVAAENGIVGIIAFGGLLLVTLGALSDARKRFKQADRRKESELAVWLAIMLIGYLVTAVTLHGAFLYILWLQIGLIVALRQLSLSYTETQVADAAYAYGSETASMPRPRATARQPARTGLDARERRASAITTTSADATDATMVSEQNKSEREPYSSALQHDNLPGQGATIPTPTRLDPRITRSLRSGSAERPAWLVAVEGALSRGNIRAARTMVEVALERDPYNAAIWAVRMYMMQAERSDAARVVHDKYVRNSLAGTQFQLNASPGPLRHEISRKFFDYWYRNGGVPIFGYPISTLLSEISPHDEVVEVQYFERARLEYHPQHEGTPLQIVPGKLGVEVQVRGVVAMQVPHGLGGEQVIFPAHGRGMASPSKFVAFWESNGGADIFGYPITSLMIDIGPEGRPLAVQYFECARLEYHPEQAGTVYDVQVSRLGTELFTAKYSSKV